MISSAGLILWDWDNTLVDTRPVFEKAFEMLKEKYPCDYFIPKNLELLLKNWGAFWEKCPLNVREEAMHFYGDTYKLLSLEYLKPIENSQDVLAWSFSNGFGQILVSNKVQWAIDKEVAHLQMASYFLRCVGVEKGLYPDKKPSLSYGQKALNGLSYEYIIVIGDSADDLLFAENLNAIGIYVNNQPQTELVRRAHQTCTSLQEVKECLKKYLSKETAII